MYDGATLLGQRGGERQRGVDLYHGGARRTALQILTATATDAAGNTGVASSPVGMIVDTTAPTAPVIVGDTIVNGR